MLKLYNTLTRKVEEFTPIHKDWVGFYSCGPTVYDFAHIGHARTFIFADILQRILESAGFHVKRVMNITDVGHLTSDSDTGEDKMELASRRSGKEGAQREQKSVWDIAAFYTDDFFNMADELNIKRPEIICKATDNISDMIDLIRILEKKGYTYQIADGVYFDTSKLSDYGKLTGQSYKDLEKGIRRGARIEMVAGKKHPTDFALWKLTPIGVVRQMEWDSPWGVGFPGWHIECSAMSMKFLGSSFDIHTGGVDHIPIHHTNEIAQSEAATGKQFVRFWLHADHLLVDGEKMSKSLGNFYRLSDIEKNGYTPLDLRYLFLTASYRQQMNFTFKSLAAGKNALQKLYDHIRVLKKKITKSKRVAPSEEKMEKVNAFRYDFTAALFNDINTSNAIAVCWNVLKSNIHAYDKLDLIYLFDEILGLGFGQITENKKQKTIPLDIQNLVQKREQLRKDKKWDEADTVRKVIEEKGYRVKDTPQGAQIKELNG